MKTLLDTNVLSEARRSGGNPKVKAVLLAAESSDQFISVISIGEIACGIAKLPAGKRKRELEHWLGLTERNFADHVLGIDRNVAHLWGELSAKLARAGKVIHPSDGLIAATAIHHGLRLMTRNVSDFQLTGVLLVNPWES